ncbi:MAG: AAA family ATPase [Acetivibrionales bacterium]
MRPRYLEIEGLNSFSKVQRIDFEALGDTGLFGIFGPTGSGKSTILDAITFALYGRVKRAEGGTQGIINTGCSTARVSFSFALSRGGTRKTYRVERIYRRKKNSPNSCEPVIARLTEVTDNGEIPLCDKATEVSNYVKELLGLSSEDFTRAVVLPQNSFQEFLLLNNKERRAMLERIFYLEEYGRKLEEKLKRKLARLKSRLDMLSGELKGYGDSTDKALEEAGKALKDAVSERERVEKELNELKKRYDEAGEVRGLMLELEEFQRKEEEHLASREIIDESRRLLEKAVKAEGLREMIHSNRELGAKLNETRQKISQVLERMPQVRDDLDEARTGYERLAEEARAEQPKLAKKRAALSDALIVKAEIASISEKARALRDSIQQLKTAEEEKTRIIDSETAEYEALVKEAERLGQEIELLKIDPDYRHKIHEGVKLENEITTVSGSINELAGREKALGNSKTVMEYKLGHVKAEMAVLVNTLEELEAKKQKHGQSKPADKNSLQKSLEEIHDIKGKYEILAFKKKELDKLRANVEKQQEEMRTLGKEARLKEEARKKACDTLEQCRLDYEKSVGETKTISAYLLAKELKEGEPCPVCGSEHHPAPAAAAGDVDMPAGEKTLRELKNKLEEAESTYKQAEMEALIIEEQLKIAMNRISQAEEELERKAAEFETEKKSLPGRLRNRDLEEIGQEIEKAADGYNNKTTALENWEKELDDLNERLRELNDKLAEKKLAENAIITELKINHESMEQLQADIKAQSSILDAAQRKHGAFLRKYGIESASSELERLSANDKKIALLQEKAGRLQGEAGDKRLKIDRIKEERRLLVEERIRKESEESGLEKQAAEKMKRLEQLAGDANIEDEIRKIDRTVNEYSLREEEMRRKLKSLEEIYNSLVMQKTLLENQEKIYSENLENDTARLRAALEEKGFDNADEALGSLLPKERQEALKTEIGEYDRISANIAAQKSLLKKKLKSRSISEEEWSRIARAYEELSAYRQECVSNSEVAKSNYAYLSKRHARWAELDKEFKELNHKYGLFVQIQKLLKAEHRKDNSFIDYIAEERLRYVAANASITLGVMTKHRYVLELDTQAGFIIRDQANGGAHRMIRSLSGGETFIVSLSLALALSEHIQLKGQSPLEFFFLDEGFGMLDQELLDTVIDALERLSCKERVIGLISHVPELKSRIGRRLIVQPATPHGNGSSVVIEKA